MSLMGGVGIAPFSFIGPKRVDDHFELRIAELPDFFIGAETVEEIYADLRGALNEYLLSLRDHGQPLPALNDNSWVLLSPQQAPREPEPQVGRLVEETTAHSGPPGLATDPPDYAPIGQVAAA